MIAGNYGYSVILKDEKLIQALKHIERSIDYYDIILPPDVFRVTKNTQYKINLLKLIIFNLIFSQGTALYSY